MYTYWWLLYPVSDDGAFLSSLPSGFPASTFAKVALKSSAAFSSSKKPTQSNPLHRFSVVLALRGDSSACSLATFHRRNREEGLA